MDWFLSACLGIALAATCGFRIFVPLLGISIGAHTGHLALSPGFEWVGSWPAMIAFGVATVLEILAYYIPWFDNLLDSVATPAAVVAGAIAASSVVGDVSPLLRWSLAVIAGGTAGVIQAGTVVLRGASTATTGGAANPVVSTGEFLAAAVGTIVAIILPIVAFILILVICILILKRLFRKKPKVPPEAQPSGEEVKEPPAMQSP